MKKINFFLNVVVSLSVILSSCEPKPSGEGITLPSINLKLNIIPDTTTVNVGDTFCIYSAIENNFEGITLIGGEGLIWSSIGYSIENPIISQNSMTLGIEGIHHVTMENYGEAIFNTQGNISDFKLSIQNDSLRLGMKFKLLKPGIYQFYVTSNFYQGSQGKSRIYPKFNVIDPHWNFFQNGIPNPTPDQATYYQSYIVAVIQ